MTDRAWIQEQDCIGCAKCLAVCPTDAIVGAPQFLHQVIEADCVGCERCVPACPVDCIILLPMEPTLDPALLAHDARLSRKQHFQFLAQRRQNRLAQKSLTQKARFLALKNQAGKSV